MINSNRNDPPPEPSTNDFSLMGNLPNSLPADAIIKINSWCMSNFIKIAEVEEYETSDLIEGRTPISVSATGSPGEVNLTVTHDGDVFAQLTINIE